MRRRSREGRSGEARTGGLHAADDKYVEVACKSAVALANATEGAGRSTVLKVTQVNPSHGFVARQALVDGYASKSPKDPAFALQPTLATPKRCKDAKELRERPTAWSLKLAEFEHQLKAIDEAQKTFVVRRMMPNDMESNGETDDEERTGEAGSDDGSAQVRNIRDPGQPTAHEHQQHMITHRPYRSWCKFFVMGRGVNSPHRRSDAQDDFEGCLHVSMDHGFFGERESEEQVALVLVIRERRHKITWAMLVPR